MNLFYPKLRRAQLLESLRFAVIGSFIAATYGIIHDQATYSISDEYFTKLKFLQFTYADLGWGPRFFVGTVGLLATWWVGFISGWFLGRLSTKRLAQDVGRRAIWRGFALIFGCALLGGITGWTIGLGITAESVPSNWAPTLRHFEIEQGAEFITVAYIHNGGYAGAFVGFVIAAVWIGRKKLNVGAEEAPDRCPDAQ
ncbi:MAG: hypothetical protein ACPGVU_16140 [Limisphaerales bacterium]